MRRLTRNSARCLKCGEEIVSTHRHDFRTCKCGNVSVDGGLDYRRRVFRAEQWEETSQYEAALADAEKEPG